MKLKKGSVPDVLWRLIRSQLTLPRFDLFLQGTLLILTLYDGYAYLLLRRSQVAGLLTPKVEEWVYIGAAVAEFLFAAILAWYGRKRRHFALSGWLFVTALAGLLVLAFPQPGVEQTDVELCGGSTVSQSLNVSRSAEGKLLIASTTLVIITAVLCALARVSVWAHGITYLDDHEPQNGAYFYGILISIRISVGVNARSWFEGHAQSPDWWKGQLSFAMLTLMFAILYTMFPKRMGSWKPLEHVEDDGFFKTVSRLSCNKMLVTQTMALSLVTAAVWGFVHHEKEFVQTRFLKEAADDWSDGRTSRLTGDILRTFVIVFFVAIFRARFSGRRSDGIKATTAAKVGGVLGVLAAIFFLGLAVLKCDQGVVQGVMEEGYEQPACSEQCGCYSESYSFAPVCSLDSLTTYFSPCHAGCSELEDLNGFLIFNNCTCGYGARAVRGACNIASCSVIFTVYQIIYVNALALSAASILMQGMVLLRAVRPTDKATSIGFAFGIISLIAHVPGHLLYMFLSDTTCALEYSGRCLLHHANFPPLLAGVSAGLTFLSAIISLIAFFIGRSAEKSTWR